MRERIPDKFTDKGSDNKERNQAPQSRQLDIPVAPPRVAHRRSDTEIFRSLYDDGCNSGHREYISTLRALSNPEGHAVLTRQERERAMAHSEWENARIDELGLEIRKLLGDEIATTDDNSIASATSASGNKTPGLEAGADATTKPLSAGKSNRQPESDANIDLSKEEANEHENRGNKPQKSDIGSVLGGRDLSQPLNLYRVPDGVMQVFIIGIHHSTPINRPYVIVRLGDQVFQTSVSKVPTGNWNEGFELVVSYHTQLFGTVHMDVYSNNTLLPDTHIGRAEIKISLLNGFPEVFTSYYEIWDKKLAASTVPDQRQRQIVSKNLGALQVRINYRFQQMEDPEPKAAKVHGAHIAGTVPSQLVNRAAHGAGNSAAELAADMSIEELVTAFAKEHSQCMEIVRKHGPRAIVRGGTTSTATSDGTRHAVGFAKVDDDTMPSSGNPADNLTSETSAKDSSSVGGWFTDLFSGSQNSTQTENAAESSTKGHKDEKGPAPTTATADAGKATNEKTLMQSLTSMFISQSTFMAIKSLERLVSMFNEGVELSNTELLGGLLTLYKFYNEAEIPGVTRPCKGEIVDSTRRLELPGRYARFALASYGWRGLYFFNRGITLMDGAKVDSDVTSVLQYLGITQEDLLGYEFRSSQLFCPSYFVAHDRQHNAVVLVVRGTMSAEDTVVDLSCEYSKWNGGLVHSGMKASAHWLFLEVVPQIFAYASSQGAKSICIVGHSLGASTAAILTIMLHEYRSQLLDLGIDMAAFDIRGYCYGPAPCISEGIADRYRDIIQTYVNRDDLVPRLCYGSVSDFRRMSISAADEADNLAQRLYAPFESSTQQQQRWNEKFARLMDIRKDILATQENLHLALPGTIYHIVSYRGATGKTSAPRNLSLEVAIARRQLFGVTKSLPEEEAEDATESGDEPPVSPPPPPPTPNTIVQQDSVSPDDLADAINTPFRESFEAPSRFDPLTASTGKGAEADKKTKPLESANTGPGARKDNAAPAAGTGGSDTFVPVWVHQVPNNAFREIILRPTIVTDHMPSAYELAFAHAIETQIYERQLRERRSKE
ncbi:hypothetical protein H4R20_002088 [Coemansia guatemalensis]|uniref:sn-1-specific diacylglycerol lipase n=1 Tax=Coemansia guatemalensis TaxID=2761395 RepID=A0A9W8HXW4_9FUNG|nr:hypothetical protein H4R20_002088 [Coemansia guatemalensis]